MKVQKKEQSLATQEQVKRFKKENPGWKPEPPLSKQEIEEFRTEAALRKARLLSGDDISCKVSPKGGVSVYGLGRFPVTLYADQWTKLLANASRIKRFVEANCYTAHSEGISHRIA